MAMIKRNPWKTALGIALFFGALQTAVGGLTLAATWVDPAMPALHYYVLGQLAPIMKVQSSQSLSIDRFLLYRQQEDLAKVQAEPEAKTSATV
jgi:hypothetical protein